MKVWKKIKPYLVATLLTFSFCAFIFIGNLIFTTSIQTTGTQSISLGNTQNEDSTDPFGIFAWVKTSTNSKMVVYSKRQGDANNYGYHFYVENYQIGFVIKGTGGIISIYGPTTISSNTWTHIGVTYNGDGDADTCRFYKNTSPDVPTKFSDANPIDSSNTGNAVIGLTQTGTYSYVNWNGYIAHPVKIPKVPSAGELTEIYNSGKLFNLHNFSYWQTMKADSRAFWFTFQNVGDTLTNGGTITDLTDNHFSGTVTNNITVSTDIP